MNAPCTVEAPHLPLSHIIRWEKWRPTIEFLFCRENWTASRVAEEVQRLHHAEHGRDIKVTEKQVKDHLKNWHLAKNFQKGDVDPLVRACQILTEDSTQSLRYCGTEKELEKLNRYLEDKGWPQQRVFNDSDGHQLRSLVLPQWIKIESESERRAYTQTQCSNTPQSHEPTRPESDSEEEMFPSLSNPDLEMSSLPYDTPVEFGAQFDSACLRRDTLQREALDTFNEPMFANSNLTTFSVPMDHATDHRRNMPNLALGVTKVGDFASPHIYQQQLSEYDSSSQVLSTPSQVSSQSDFIVTQDDSVSYKIFIAHFFGGGPGHYNSLDQLFILQLLTGRRSLARHEDLVEALGRQPKLPSHVFSNGMNTVDDKPAHELLGCCLSGFVLHSRAERDLEAPAMAFIERAGQIVDNMIRARDYRCLKVLHLLNTLVDIFGLNQNMAVYLSEILNTSFHDLAGNPISRLMEFMVRVLSRRKKSADEDLADLDWIWRRLQNYSDPLPAIIARWNFAWRCISQEVQDPVYRDRGYQIFKELQTTLKDLYGSSHILTIICRATFARATSHLQQQEGGDDPLRTSITLMEAAIKDLDKANFHYLHPLRLELQYRLAEYFIDYDQREHAVDLLARVARYRTEILGPDNKRTKYAVNLLDKTRQQLSTIQTR